MGRTWDSYGKESSQPQGARLGQFGDSRQTLSHFLSVHHVCQAESLGPCYFKCTLGTSSMDFTFNLVRNAESQPFPHLNLHFSKTTWWFICTLEFWEHWCRSLVTYRVFPSLRCPPHVVTWDEGVGRALWQKQTLLGLWEGEVRPGTPYMVFKTVGLSFNLWNLSQGCGGSQLLRESW